MNSAREIAVANCGAEPRLESSPRLAEADKACTSVVSQAQKTDRYGGRSCILPIASALAPSLDLAVSVSDSVSVSVSVGVSVSVSACY